MAITLTTSDPSHGSQDVYINKNIALVFNKAIATAAISRNVFILTDVVKSTSFPVNPAADPNNAARIVVSLYGVLRENTLYRLMVVGTDNTIGTEYLTAADGDSLTTSIVVEFTTGDQAFRIDVNIQKEAANLTLEGDLSLPQNVKALGEEFTVSHVRPRNHMHNVPVSLTGDKTIRFTFTKPLLSGVSTETWYYIDAYPLLDDSGYLAISGVLQANNSGAYDFSLPTPTVTVTGSDLLFQFDKYFPNNVGVRIDLTTNIKSSSGDYYGGSMRYDINTQLYPDIVGIHSVGRELNSTIGGVYDNFVGQLIFKNQIFLYQKLGNQTTDSATKKYVLASAVLDIIEDQEYAKFVVAGTRRQLGDLNASVDSLVGRLAMKIASMKKLQEEAFQSLIRGWQFKTVIKSEGIAETFIDRMWHNPDSMRFISPADKFFQPNIPAANVATSRQAKVGSTPWL